VVEMYVGKITRGDIDLNKLVEDIAKSAEEGIGAIALFIGVVKGVVDGDKVFSLLYEEYEPYATRKLESIASDLSSRKGVRDVLIYHWTGERKVGEITVVIAVSAIGRKEAIETLAEAIERVKKEVPIFKLEKRESGDYWIIGDGTRVKRK